MRTRKLSMATLVAAMFVAVILSLAVQPASRVGASYVLESGCWDVVDNGGFESTDGWVINPGSVYLAKYSETYAHSGDWSMQVGIPSTDYDRYAFSSFYQQVTIPFEAETATLAFWYKPYSYDTSGQDKQGMILYDAYWNHLETVLSVRSNSGTWTHKEWDVSDYAGETVRLYYYVSNNPNYQYGQTWMYVDDVSLEWCGEGEPGPTDVQVGFDPIVKTVYPYSGTFEMSVVITDVADLGAFEFDIEYDPEIVVVEDVELEGFLERTGRIAYTGEDDTLKLDGTYSFWAYTLPPGGDLGRPGPSGSGILVTTFLSPIDDGETDLTLSNVLLSDTEGDEISVDYGDVIDGQVIVKECVGDLNHDGVVDIVDVMLVAANWGCEDGVDECYDDDYDLNDSGAIDVGDIMEVVASWGVCEVDVESAFVKSAGFSDAATSLLKIQPRDCDVDAGDTFVVSMIIEDATDLGAFQFDLRYDPALLQIVGDPTLGDFLESTGRSAIAVPTQPDNQAGRMTIAYASYGDEPGPSGDGTLASVELEAEWIGEGSIWLEKAKVTDTEANWHEPFAQSAEVTVPGSYVYLPLAVRQ
jgi:hypothetical protein